MRDTRPEAAPDDVARWVDAVQTMNAQDLGEFDRAARGT
jgi:hypothetical protein